MIFPQKGRDKRIVIVGKIGERQVEFTQNESIVEVRGDLEYQYKYEAKIDGSLVLDPKIAQRLWEKYESVAKSPELEKITDDIARELL